MHAAIGKHASNESVAGMPPHTVDGGAGELRGWHRPSLTETMYQNMRRVGPRRACPIRIYADIPCK
jgi:hypothetical protein